VADEGLRAAFRSLLALPIDIPIVGRRFDFLMKGATGRARGDSTVLCTVHLCPARLDTKAANFRDLEAPSTVRRLRRGGGAAGPVDGSFEAQCAKAFG